MFLLKLRFREGWFLLLLLFDVVEVLVNILCG